MSLSEPKTVPLRIRGADAMTEVRVLDGTLTRVPLDSNTGAIDLTLTPGIYEIGFRRDGPWETQRIVVRPESEPLTVTPNDRPSLFKTSAVANTVSETVADAASVMMELKSPDGSAFDDARAAQIRVELVDSHDAILAPLYPAAVSPGTWRFAAPPGCWRLRITQPGPTPPLELPLIVYPGWALQLVAPATVVAACEDEPEHPEIALDQLRVRIPPLHRIGAPLGPKVISYEGAALSALESGRWLYGKAFDKLLRQLLHDKTDNAMLGLYAAYLCYDTGRIASTVELLDALLMPGPAGSEFAAGHPDVRALRLRCLLAAGAPLDDIAPFPFPPLLARGWSTVLEAARIRPELIPADSLSGRIADRLWPSGLWLAWYGGPTAQISTVTAPAPPPPARARARSLPPAAPAPPPFEQSRDTIIAALGLPELREWFRAARVRLEASLETASAGVEWEHGELNSIEARLGGTLCPIAPTEDDQEKYQRIALSGGHSGGADAAALTAKLGLPPDIVAEAAASLAAKLLKQAVRLKLDRKVRTPVARPDIIIPYDPTFLGDGFDVPLPTLTGAARAAAFADGTVIDYTHYSLVMHRERRTAVYTANNVDAARKVQVSDRFTWQMDERVGEYQLGRETYDDNQIDKGHLVRREDVLWGSVAEAKAANKATFFYTNASPQHQNFNQDEWKSLEDWVLTRATDFSYRLCVFSGPVFADSDPTLDELPPNLRRLVAARGPAKLPAAFWKIIVLRDAEAGGDDLAAIAFAMKQSEMWTDKNGKKLLNLKVHQVTVAAIEQWTGLDFGGLKDVDELAFSPRQSTRAAAAASWPEVHQADDIVWSGAERRARGIRAVRSATAPEGGGTRTSAPPQATAAEDCRCHDDFDAEQAVAALSRDVARLTDLIVAQTMEAAPEAPAPRNRARGLAAGPTPEEEELDPRIEAAVAAAPEETREELRSFARALAEQGEIVRGLRPPEEPKQLLRIVGGNVVPPGAFQHCVCIGDARQWMCTGALIAPQVVLTAAHCGGAITRVGIGGQVMPRLSPGTRVVPVRRAIVHPAYRPHPLNENDINLLILDAPALVPPAPIATLAQIAAARGVDIVGFGYNDPNRPVGFGVKRRVTINIPPRVKARPTDNFSAEEALYGLHSDYEFVCGRKSLGKDSCNGDSGGPVYVTVQGDFRLAGLTSRATDEAVDNCGDGGVYVRPGFFRPWIDATVAANGLPPIAWR
jgi:endonuclease G, mitochondrial